MGRSQRVKGAVYEREVAAKLTAALGTTAKRRLGQAREGGHDIDIDLPLVTECKRRKRPMEAMRWLKQADDSAKEGMSLVVTRGDDSRDAVVMYLDDFLPVYAAYLRWTEQMEELL